MSNENLINLSLSDAQLANVDAALATLEAEFAGLVALSVRQKRSMLRMGERSESFSRQALQVISQNPQMIPANIPVASAVADLKLLDQLRPRIVRMTRLCQRANETDAALGNNVMAVALKSYSLLKLTGRTEGVEELRRDLSTRFSRSKRAKPSEEGKAA